MRLIRSVSVLAALALVAGCGSSGGGGPHVTPTVMPSPTPTPPPGGTPVHVTFNPLGPMPTAIAVQIGTGAWTASAVSGTFSFSVPIGTTKYALAYICPAANEFGLIQIQTVIEATTTDPTSYAEGCFGPPPASNETGSVSAATIASTTQVEVLGKFGAGANVTGTSGAFTASFANGTNDLAVLAENASNNVLGVKIVRGQAVPGTINGGAPVALAATDAVTSSPFAVTNIAAGYNASPAMSAQYFTSNGTSFQIMQTPAASYSVIPATETGAGDFYEFSANDADLTTHEDLGSSYTTTSGGGPVSIALPPVWANTAPTAAVFPAFTFNYSGFTGDAVIEDEAATAWANGAVEDNFEVYASSAYAGASGTVTVPNLTALPGFFASAPASTTIEWEAIVTGGTYSELQTTAPANGTLDFINVEGSYTQP